MQLNQQMNRNGIFTINLTLDQIQTQTAQAVQQYNSIIVQQYNSTTVVQYQNWLV